MDVSASFIASIDGVSPLTSSNLFRMLEDKLVPFIFNPEY
jgi:hypothetical protein